MKRTIAIVAGGDSSEHDVSMRSAEGILSFMDKEKYDCYVVEIKQGNWNAYDTWSAVAAGSVTEPAATAPLPTAQELQAARKYLSSNKPKLAAAEGDAANALRKKMQQRVSLLLSAGQGFEPAYQSELEALGLLFS